MNLVRQDAFLCILLIEYEIVYACVMHVVHARVVAALNLEIAVDKVSKIAGIIFPCDLPPPTSHTHRLYLAFSRYIYTIKNGMQQFRFHLHAMNAK